MEKKTKKKAVLKKILIVLGCIGFIGASMITLTACQKDNTTQKEIDL